MKASQFISETKAALWAEAVVPYVKATQKLNDLLEEHVRVWSGYTTAPLFDTPEAFFAWADSGMAQFKYFVGDIKLDRINLNKTDGEWTMSYSEFSVIGVKGVQVTNGSITVDSNSVSFPKTGIIPSPKEVLDGLRAFDAYKAEVDKTKADIAEINEAFHLWLYAVHTLGKFKLRGDSITVLKAIANLDRVVFDEEQKLYADNDKYINAKELVRIDDNFKTPRGRVEVQAVTVASALVRTVNNGHDAELTFN